MSLCVLLCDPLEGTHNITGYLNRLKRRSTVGARERVFSYMMELTHSQLWAICVESDDGSAPTKLIKFSVQRSYSEPRTTLIAIQSIGSHLSQLTGCLVPLNQIDRSEFDANEVQG